MPELPEVETVRRGLEPVLAGRVLARVRQFRADLRWPLPERFAERLEGRRVGGVGRRGKFLLIGLDGGESWIVHLGMSGRVLVAAPEAEAAPLGAFHHAVGARTAHDHVVVATEAGAVVTYNDARRFGAMDLSPTGELERHPWLARLGPEPLGNAFSGPALAAALARKATSVKAALMDQRVVAGLGNISVYDREGAPCPRPGCRGTVRRRVQAGRSSFYCPRCQR